MEVGKNFEANQPSQNKIMELNTEEENSEIEKRLTDEEALDIQINYLKNSTRDILKSIILNEDEPTEASLPDNLDKSINLYLRNIYNKHYNNEMENLLFSMNKYTMNVKEKNKEYLHNIEFWNGQVLEVSKEKMELQNEKEKLDEELEIIKANNMIKSQKKRNSKKELLDEIEKKEKKLKKLTDQYNAIYDEYKKNQNGFQSLEQKLNKQKGDFQIYQEKIKQKELILNQIEKENENLRTEIFGKKIKKNKK